jgi:hypothetical protein
MKSPLRLADGRLLAPVPAATPLYIVLAVGLVAMADYASGPAIHFPILYTLPVAWAAWLGYRRLSSASGLALVLWRAFIEGVVWRSDPNPVILAVNGVIRLIVLVTISLLVYQVGESIRQLTTEVALLQGILPICAYCKRIRNEADAWQSLEGYIASRAPGRFTHGICPSCARSHFPEPGEPPAER